MLIDLLWALALMGSAVLILIAEMFLVSFGVLALVSLGLGVASVMFAFRAHPVAGWTMLVIAPFAAWYVVAWCMRRIGLSGIVAQAEITAATGCHAAAAAAGALPGAEGVLMTDAMPTGRARFAQGEVDVAVTGPTLARGARVRVLAASGAVVSVTAADPAPSTVSPRP